MNLHSSISFQRPSIEKSPKQPHIESIFTDLNSEIQSAATKASYNTDITDTVMQVSP